jgi:hypothetical protein
MRRNLQYSLPVSALVAFWLLTSATSGIAADPSFYVNLFSMVEVGSIEGFPADVKKSSAGKILAQKESPTDGRSSMRRTLSTTTCPCGDS